MALGWDQAIAEAALYLDMPLVAYIPFVGQESRWPETSQQRYWHILNNPNTEYVIVCEGGYGAWKMQKRNEAMVNASMHLLALWDGSTGGTGNCIRYAKAKQRRIENVWDEWVEYLNR